jgi:hypothetical protein
MSVIDLTQSPTLKRKRQDELPSYEEAMADNNPVVPVPKRQKPITCAENGCAMGRVTGMTRCPTHVKRCGACNTPIVRGKICAACREMATQAAKACSQRGCNKPRLPRLLTCQLHTLTCKRCHKPMKRGKSCAHCVTKARGGKKTRDWTHERWAREIFEHAFWPNKAPPCPKCSKKLKKCGDCTAIESCRVYYIDGQTKRKRWFDFDIVLKVPVRKGGKEEWKIVAVVEVDGPSHYQAIKFGKAKSDIKDQRRRDQMKREYCRKNKIFLARIPCYFTRTVVERKRGKMPNKKKKMLPNKPKFIKLVHTAVRELYKQMRAGKMGPEACKMLRKNWDPAWASHPVANP